MERLPDAQVQKSNTGVKYLCERKQRERDGSQRQYLCLQWRAPGAGKWMYRRFPKSKFGGSKAAAFGYAKKYLEEYQNAYKPGGDPFKKLREKGSAFER